MAIAVPEHFSTRINRAILEALGLGLVPVKELTLKLKFDEVPSVEAEILVSSYEVDAVSFVIRRFHLVPSSPVLDQVEQLEGA